VFFALREAVKAAREANNITEPLILDMPCTAKKLRLAVADDIVRRAVVEKKDDEQEFFVRIES
jgi:xanthine dehydrogenase/oxidase